MKNIYAIWKISIQSSMITRYEISLNSEAILFVLYGATAPNPKIVWRVGTWTWIMEFDHWLQVAELFHVDCRVTVLFIALIYT